MTAWTKIQNIEVPAGGQSSIVFNNIPQLYDDLIIKMSLRTTSANIYDDLDITFNGETARSWRGFYYVPTSVATNGSSSFNIVAQTPGSPLAESVFSNTDLYIVDYKSTALKIISSESVVANASGSQYMMVINSNTVTNSAAINTITLSHAFGVYTFVQYSSATLYGITKGSSGGVTVS